MKFFWVSLCLISTAFAASIEEVRTRCEVLTNPDIVKAEGYVLMDRKPAQLFLVRRLCEKQETALDEKRFPDLQAIQDLDLIYASYIDRHRVEAGIGLFDILKMGLSHDLSPYVLRYKKTPGDGDGIKSGPFWHQEERPLFEAFDRQWKALGVDPNVTWLRVDKLEGKGSVAKVHANDIRNGARWLVKWGDEIHSDPVASRIFAALGFNVDYPFYKGRGEVRLLLGKQGKKKRNVRQLVNFIFNSYKINISPFIIEVARVTNSMVRAEPMLQGRENEIYLTFTGIAMEPRPSLETRLGPIMTDIPGNLERRELRGNVLAQAWVGNWDTKSDNSLLSIVGNQLKGSFSDLGVSLGVKISKFPRDLKAGLVNEFPWDVLSVEGNELRLNTRMNQIPEAWRKASWSDLAWMAYQISRISPEDLREILSHSGWPRPVQELYFMKLAARRQQILQTFGMSDEFHWEINREFSVPGLIEKGVLLREPDLASYPEGLFQEKGRFRGYGW